MLGVWMSDILCFWETWLTPKSIIDSHLEVNDFLLFRPDRPEGLHGGVMLYTKNTLKCRRRMALAHEKIECIVLELIFQRDKHLLFFCYWPPNQSPDFFFETLSTKLTLAETEQAVISVIGDFNAKHPSWESTSLRHSAGTKFYEILLDFSLTQCIDSPTRYSKDGTNSSSLTCTLLHGQTLWTRSW